MRLWLFFWEFSRLSSASKIPPMRKTVHGAPITILRAVPRIAGLQHFNNA
jgi:hypothetical protein